MSDKILEGFWDCPDCGTTKILGRYRECPNCGTPRAEGTKFYLTGESKEVSGDLKGRFSGRPDWVCPYCSTLNSTNDTQCKSCGASVSGSTSDYFSAKKDKENKNSDGDLNLQESGTSFSNPQMVSNLRSQNTKLEAKNMLKIGAILLGFTGVIAAFVALFIWIFMPKTISTELQNKWWERTISVEELKTFNESGWSKPAGTREQYRQTELKEYKDVLDHYETVTRTEYYDECVGYKTVPDTPKDNGDGTFTQRTKQVPQYEKRSREVKEEKPVYRKEPVYATKYYYEIDRWVHYKDFTVSGGYKDDIEWPAVEQGAKLRESSRQERYYIDFLNAKEKQVEKNISFELWNQLEVGNTYSITMQAGAVTEIK